MDSRGTLGRLLCEVCVILPRFRWKQSLYCTFFKKSQPMRSLRLAASCSQPRLEVGKQEVIESMKKRGPHDEVPGNRIWANFSPAGTARSS